MAGRANPWTVRLLIGLCVVAGVLAALALLSGDPFYTIPERLPGSPYRAHDGLIADTARRHGVPAPLLKALAWHASRFRADAREENGRMGLLGVTPDTGKQWADALGVETFAPTDLLDPQVNLEAGAWRLAALLDHHAVRDDPVPFALAEYLAGPEAVGDWIQAAGGGAVSAADFRKAMESTTTWNAVEYIVARQKFYVLRGEFADRTPP